MTELLRATGIRKSFGGVHAVRGMDIAVPEGGLMALIGPNGAGKSTFFHCLSGALRPDAGTVQFDGHDVTKLPVHQHVHKGLVRTFQLTRALARMTVKENLMLAAPSQRGESLLAAGLPKLWRSQEAQVSQAADEALSFFKLDHLSDEYSGNLSGGQKKLMDLARAFMAQPKMMLLDEPLAGVNPSLGRDIMKRIEELRDGGMTFLIVEHNMESVFRHCDPIVVMAQGAPLATGTADEIRNNPTVQEAYLGI